MADNNGGNTFEVTTVSRERKQLSPEQIKELKRRKSEEASKRQLTPDELAAIKRRRELREQRKAAEANGQAVQMERRPQVKAEPKKAPAVENKKVPPVIETPVIDEAETLVKEEVKETVIPLEETVEVINEAETSEPITEEKPETIEVKAEETPEVTVEAKAEEQPEAVVEMQAEENAEKQEVEELVKIKPQGEMKRPQQSGNQERRVRSEAPQGQRRPQPNGENPSMPVRKRPQNPNNTFVSDRLTKETKREKRERLRYEKQIEIEESASIFIPKHSQGNYFINLFIVTFKMALICLLLVGISGIGFLIGMSKSYLETVPELDFDIVVDQEQATTIMDINGNFLGSYYNMENREWASLNEMKPELRNAVIAIEDVRFYRHMGMDFKRLFSVIISNVTSDSMQGGSTITQQLIKNTMLSFEQTYKRKIQEASLALELERQYDKDTILEAYLNTIYMGGSCYGMKTAAKDYFNKELSELTLRECACLAGMIQNPSRYNPRTNYYVRNNPDRTNNRTNLVLYEMRENGLITEEEYQAARNDTLTVLETSPYDAETGMIYYMDYVIENVVDNIIEQDGLEDNSQNRKAIKEEIRTSGYKIYTTLDEKKQKAAEDAVYSFNGYPKMRYESDSYTIIGRNPDGTVIRLVQPQTAVAVMDYRTGYVVALVGGRQAPSGSLEFNRAFQSTMPVGSAIKPIAVYAPAIEAGKSIGSVYYDYAMPLEGWDSAKGYPANNSRSYSGLVTMRKAFVNSLNTSAAQALLYDVGIENSYNTLISLGVDPDHISKTGSGLALGSSGITPLEMAGAFSAIANMGEYIEPIAFTKVERADGSVRIDMLQQQERRRVLSESTAWQVTDMMRSVATSGIKNKIAVPGQTVYGKTGTNSESRGVFFAGFTGYYTCCVWVGSDAYKPLQSNAQGSAYAGPLFSAVMTELHKGLPDKKANDVDPATIGVKKLKYCSVTGMLASSSCVTTHTEYGNPTNMKYCNVHKVVQICTESGMIATASCPKDKVQKQSAIYTLPKTGLLAHMYKVSNTSFVAAAGKMMNQLEQCNIQHVVTPIAPTTPTTPTDPNATTTPTTPNTA